MKRRLLCGFLAFVLAVCLLPLNAFEVQAASAMKASNHIIKYLKTMEGFTAIPRWDYVQWTVGYGTRCPDEDLERYKEEGIPIEEADALFLEHLVYFEEQVNAFIDRNNLTYTQNQFDAVLSITYNCGAAWLYGSSDLKNAVCNGTSGNKLMGLMTQWCTAGGQYLSGLMRRRLTEADIYLNGRYSTQPSDNLCYVFYNAGEGKASGVAQGYDCNLYAVPMVTATREGYTFLGWYTAAVGGVKVTYLDENLHQTTLYAHWQKGEGVYEGGDVVEEGILVTVTGEQLNVRSGPGTDYSVVGAVYSGDKVTVTQTQSDSSGRLWGKIENGWIALEYTDYGQLQGDGSTTPNEDQEEETVYEVPMLATIVGSNAVTVYNGPDTGYPQVGTLSVNTEVLLVDTYQMFTVWWGKLESGGWICLDQNVLIHDDQMLAHSASVTITNAYVNVRSGPGTEYSWQGSLNKDDMVTVLAIEDVDGVLWGRYTGGWFSLAYSDFDATKLDEYRYHSYGEWYETEEFGDSENGLERRDCLYCDHYETREIDLSAHNMGEWTVVEEATCTEDGQMRRECQDCEFTQIKLIKAEGHSYGDWYVTVAATYEAPGEERRDCQSCEACETREVPQLQITVRVYATVICTTLNVRSGPGTGYSLVGSVSYGTVHEVLEQQTVDGKVWGRIESGWICLTGNTTLEEVTEYEEHTHTYGEWYTVTEATAQQNGQERRDCACGHYETRETVYQQETVTKTYGTLTGNDYLNIRAGLGTGYDVVGQLYYGERVEILEIATLNGKEWGRIDRGWICLTGYITLEEVEEPVEHSHSYGDWYTVTEATCTQDGLEQRDCACGHCEIRSVTASGHSYEAVVTDPTCTEQGYTTHTCHCGDTYVDSNTEALGHSYVDGVCQHCGDVELAELTMGDVNEDGVINHLDAMLIAQLYVGMLEQEQIPADMADLNEDGQVNHLDAMIVAQRYVGVTAYISDEE